MGPPAVAITGVLLLLLRGFWFGGCCLGIGLALSGWAFTMGIAGWALYGSRGTGREGTAGSTAA